MNTKNYILTKDVAEKKLQRIAYEIVERNAGEKEILLAGIKENGLVIANKMKQLLEPILKENVNVISVSIDKKQPDEVLLYPAIYINDKIVILVDDVANSGKTLLYSLKPFLMSYPKKIQTLVLVERTHKAFPVNSDYVGLSVATTLQEHIIVEVKDDNIEGAYLV